MHFSVSFIHPFCWWCSSATPTSTNNFVIILGFSLSLRSKPTYLASSSFTLFPSGQNVHPVILKISSSNCSHLNYFFQLFTRILWWNCAILLRIYEQAAKNECPNLKATLAGKFTEIILRWLVLMGNEIVLRTLSKSALVLISNVIATTIAVCQVILSPWFQGGNLESWEVAL